MKLSLKHGYITYSGKKNHLSTWRPLESKMVMRPTTNVWWGKIKKKKHHYSELFERKGFRERPWSAFNSEWIAFGDSATPMGALKCSSGSIWLDITMKLSHCNRARHSGINVVGICFLQIHRWSHPWASFPGTPVWTPAKSHNGKKNIILKDDLNISLETCTISQLISKRLTGPTMNTAWS